jgi:hypothetical protein
MPTVEVEAPRTTPVPDVPVVIGVEAPVTPLGDPPAVIVPGSALPPPPVLPLAVLPVPPVVPELPPVTVPLIEVPVPPVRVPETLLPVVAEDPPVKVPLAVLLAVCANAESGRLKAITLRTEMVIGMNRFFIDIFFYL